ncbi:MAG: DUF2232 domain-containing protein [Christensenellales bacterium]
MDRIKKEEYKNVLIAYLTATALMYLGLDMPVIIIAVPFVLVYAIVRCGFLFGGAASILSFTTICLLNFNVTCIWAAAFLPVCFAAAYAIRSKKRFRDSVIVSSAAALVGIALAIGMLSLFTGKSVVDFIVDYIGENIKALGDKDIKTLYQMARYSDILSGAVTQEVVTATPPATAIAEIQDKLRETLNFLFVAGIAVYSMITGLLYYVIPRAIAKKQKIDVIMIPSLSEYVLPKRFWLAYILSYFAAAIGASYGWQSFDVLELTLYYVYAFVFVVQGLSLLDFFYKKRNMGIGARVLLHIVVTLILSSILIWVGLLENAVGIRKRISQREG